MKILYTTSAVASGDGRNGRVESTDGALATDVRMPPELGGQGGATNPEQLFAAGYASCFLSALQLVAPSLGVDAADAEVVVDVSVGGLPSGAFGLAAAIEVTLPATPRDLAEKVAARAHEVCPYSNATRGNIEVALSVV